MLHRFREEVLTEASSRELHPPDESESGTEEGASDDVEPTTKRRRGPDTRSFHRPEIRLVHPTVLRTEVECVPSHLRKEQARLPTTSRDQTEHNMIPIAYREDATIRDWLSQKSWLQPTPQGLLCRFCTQSVTSRTCLFVGKPFP